MPKNDLIIYEGAMCCSTGVCGPEPDKKLIEFSETIKKLQAMYDGRLRIIRASLTFNTLMFIANKEVSQLVKENGQDVLPITAVNGEIVARQRYLKFDELKDILERRIKND
ncbi:MAG: arsenite efflux transporter metallochaperone ArsD [Smithella sp.]